MKKITKLINGSIIVFVICLIAVLTLTSCNNTNNDNLRKGVDNGIVETEEKESDYIVTKEEFDKAFDLSDVNNFRAEFYTNDEISQIQETLGDVLRYSKDDINWIYIPTSDITYGHPDEMSFEYYTYNPDKKQYEKFENNKLIEILKFKNKKIIYKETHSLNNIYVTKFIYGKVNFEVPKEV